MNVKMKNINDIEGNVPDGKNNVGTSKLLVYLESGIDWISSFVKNQRKRKNDKNGKNKRGDNDVDWGYYPFPPNKKEAYSAS